MTHRESKRLFKLAKKHIPGGVNSPVRAFKSVGYSPVFIKRASGSRIYDVDGNSYIDYVLSWGPMILGHAHPSVIKALRDAVRDGTSYGAPTGAEIELATLIKKAFPSIEMVRMVSSGTEATMSAIRVARGFTGRDKVIKFDGCYHGHADGLLVRAGSGAATFGVPDSPGVPKDYTKNTSTLPYNDLNALKKTIDRSYKDIACVIIEPIAGNMGCVPPGEGFLQGVREITQKYDIVLIFDEVITGFRVAFGGAQELYGIKADMTCLGKILGGGLPVGAYGGRKDIMSVVSPEGKVYQAGTLSGNPLAMKAGVETLSILYKDRRSIYKDLDRLSGMLEEGLKDSSKKAGVKATFNRVGSMFCVFFTDGDVWDYASAKMSDTKVFARYFKGMLSRGIYLAPSQFESGFLSIAHTTTDIEKTVKASYESLK
ncbi:MAG: glutamate-1-semialdehyde 2,1-aminomutase [Nitrospirota bacterium]